MRKRILAMLLAALMLSNMNACHQVTNDDIQEGTTNNSSVAEDLSTNNTQNNSENNEIAPIQEPTYTTQILVEVLRLSSTFLMALTNEQQIKDVVNDSLTYLNNFIVGSIAYAYVSALDLDENGVNDVLVLECGDKVIVLKEHEGKVYAWQFRHTALYNIKVDGTYSWSDQAGKVYGTDKLQFDGYKKNPIELYRVEYNEKFYINEVEVTEETFLAYVQNQEFAEIATQYWWKTDFETPDYQMNGK